MPGRCDTNFSLRLLGRAVLAAAFSLGVAACSSDDEPAASEPVVSSSVTTDEQGDEPGPEIDGQAATFRAPPGFVLIEIGEDTPALAAAGPAGAIVSLVEVELAGASPALDRQEAIALEGLGAKFVAAEPLEVDGVEMWHLTSPDSRGQHVDVYGAVVDGTAVRLTIRLADAEYDEAERAAVNEQVLASWSWA